MMQMTYPNGATSLDPDEADGLIPAHIVNQSQLNDWENRNILEAETWLKTARLKDYLTIEFLKRLHKHMFGKTWRWAGQFRKTGKNIGVEIYQIQSMLKNLLDDAKCQLANHYDTDEIGCKFHHRLVQIHAFPNGNGRHARLMTDIILMQNDQPRFTWGSQNLGSSNATRNKYIHALQEADKHHYKELMDFVRS